jgi:O-antigen ligase
MLCSVFWSPLPKLSMYYVFKYFCFFAFALSTVTMYAHHPERLRAVVLKGLAIGGFTIVGRYLVEFVRGGGLAILTHPTTSEFFTEMCAFSANFGGGKNLLGSWMSFNITFTVPMLILCLNCRKTAYLLLIAAVPIFVLTFTRTAVLGLAFFIVCVPLFMKRREIRSIVRLLPLRTIVLLGLLFIVLNPLDVRAKFTQRMIYPLLYYQGKTTDLGAEGRHTLWTGAWRTIQENPIFGTGIGTLGDGRIQYPEDNFHNVYLQIVAQTGMVGLLLFTAWSFVLFAMAAALSRSLPHRDFRDVLFGRLLLLNLATYYFKSLFMFQYFDLEIWTLIIFISCHYYYVLHTHVTPSGCHTLP